METKIRPTNSHNKTWLLLEGTILTCREKTDSSEITVDIPVELISISEKKRFMGQRLVIALVSLVFSLAIGGALAAIPYWTMLYDEPKHEAVYAIAGLCVIFLPFIFLLSHFFVKQRTATLTITPGGNKISFWILKKEDAKLDALLSDILRRQKLVRDQIPFPLSSSSVFSVERPWKKTIGVMWLCALPAIIFHKPWWLFLSLLPLCKFIWNVICLAEQPALYRRAYRAGLRQDWNLALSCAKQLYIDLPDYQPGQELLFQVHLRRSEIEEAYAVFETLRKHLDPESVQQIESELILHKRISNRRCMKKPNS